MFKTGFEKVAVSEAWAAPKMVSGMMRRAGIQNTRIAKKEIEGIRSSGLSTDQSWSKKLPHSMKKRIYVSGALSKKSPEQARNVLSKVLLP